MVSSYFKACEALLRKLLVEGVVDRWKARGIRVRKVPSGFKVLYICSQFRRRVPRSKSIKRFFAGKLSLRRLMDYVAWGIADGLEARCDRDGDVFVVRFYSVEPLLWVGPKVPPSYPREFYEWLIRALEEYPCGRWFEDDLEDKFRDEVRERGLEAVIASLIDELRLIVERGLPRPRRDMKVRALVSSAWDDYCEEKGWEPPSELLASMDMFDEYARELDELGWELVYEDGPIVDHAHYSVGKEVRLMAKEVTRFVKQPRDFVKFIEFELRPFIHLDKRVSFTVTREDLERLEKRFREFLVEGASMDTALRRVVRWALKADILPFLL